MSQKKFGGLGKPVFKIPKTVVQRGRKVYVIAQRVNKQNDELACY